MSAFEPLVTRKPVRTPHAAPLIMTPPSLDAFPGWRSDPDVPGRERFWNGVAWTDKVRLASRARPMPVDQVEESSATGVSRARVVLAADDILIRIEPPEPVGAAAAVVPVEEAAEGDSVTLEPVALDSAPPPVGQRPLRFDALTPGGGMETPSTEAPPTQRGTPVRSVFGAESNLAPFESIRSVRLPSAAPQRRSRWPSTLRRGVVPFLCLLVGAGAGFAAGYVVAGAATEDGSSLETPSLDTPSLDSRTLSD